MERLHLGDVLTSSLSRPSSNLLRRDGRAVSEKEWLPAVRSGIEEKKGFDRLNFSK